MVVKALHFNTRFLNDLLIRVEDGIEPERIVPREVVFTEQEVDTMNREIRQVIPPF